MVKISNVHVMGTLTVNLSSSGHNDLTAQNVTCFFGIIFGGVGSGNHYHNLGGNRGFFVLGFGP